jgi:predicted AAA+ superfamily ATPase
VISRLIRDKIVKTKRSVLILGPRQVGKSSLVREIKCDLEINFADQQQFLKHTQDFDLLRAQIERIKAQSIFIDEVQRIPDLLNTIQALVDENPRLKFYLTGSSARKLKRGGANLLPGRIINFSMGPLILKELDYKLEKENLLFGFLPGIYCESDLEEKKGLLKSYCANYINEEIKSESLVRDIPSFSRFLDLGPELVGQFIDYSKVAKKAKISRHQVPRYFEIYEDTMLGYRLFHDQDLEDQFDLVKHPKFYFFDVGVHNGLLNGFSLSADRLGTLCEQVAFEQIYHSAKALQKEIKMNTLRTRGGAEVDFLVKIEGKTFGFEIKATDKIQDDDVRHLNHFKKTFQGAHFFLLHFGKDEIKKNGIWCLPLGAGFKEIGL